MVLKDARQRWRAASVHAAIGGVLALVLALVVRYLWYPDALFAATGAPRLLALVAGVLLVAGPLATFTVYVPGKRGLRFDLAAIAVLQATCVAYGLWTLFETRPVYVVFVKDRFELVRAGDFPDTEIARAPASPYLRLPLDGPRYAAARMPTDRVERERIVFLAPSGLDLHHMPQHYLPYEQARPDVTTRAEAIPKLRALNPGAGAEIDALARGAGVPEEQLGFLPMRAGERDLTVLVDKRSGAPLRLLALRPWEF